VKITGSFSNYNEITCDSNLNTVVVVLSEASFVFHIDLVTSQLMFSNSPFHDWKYISEWDATLISCKNSVIKLLKTGLQKTLPIEIQEVKFGNSCKLGQLIYNSTNYWILSKELIIMKKFQIPLSSLQDLTATLSFREIIIQEFLQKESIRQSQTADEFWQLSRAWDNDDISRVDQLTNCIPYYQYFNVYDIHLNYDLTKKSPVVFRNFRNDLYKLQSLISIIDIVLYIGAKNQFSNETHLISGLLKDRLHTYICLLNQDFISVKNP